MFNCLMVVPSSEVQLCPVEIDTVICQLRTMHSKYAQKKFFSVKTTCEEMSKFGDYLLQNFNDIKICSCNDTLGK